LEPIVELLESMGPLLHRPAVAGVVLGLILQAALALSPWPMVELGKDMEVLPKELA
jgi:hypothetical protein